MKLERRQNIDSSSILINEKSMGQTTDFENQSDSNYNKRSHYLLEACLNMFIDITSILDLASDLVIIL